MFFLIKVIVFNKIISKNFMLKIIKFLSSLVYITLNTRVRSMLIDTRDNKN